MDFLMEILVVLVIALFVIVLIDILRGKKTVYPRDLWKLVPSASDLPGSGWGLIGEWWLPWVDVVWKNAVDKNPLESGYEEGFMNLFERGEERVAFCILRFTSSELAAKAFSGIRAEWGDKELYGVSVGEESIGLYLRSNDADGILFREGELVAFVLLGKPGVRRGESLKFADRFVKIIWGLG